MLMRIYCRCFQVHVLPREMLGLSTFGIAMALLKWLPVRLVDRILLAAAHLALGDTGQLGLRRPKTGPIELKNLTGRTPVLDVGTLDYIKSGKIKVSASRQPCFFVSPKEHSAVGQSLNSSRGNL
jgi:hypothetical protein